MKSILTAFALLLVAFSSSLAQPTGYYDNAVGLEGEALREALRVIVTAGHKSNSYDDLYGYYQSTDNYTNGKVWDMYSMKADGTANYWFTHYSDKCGNYGSEGDCYNREHSVPQSWFGGSSPMYADLFIVIPSDGKVNGMRSNYPFGETASPTYTSSNGSKKGSCTYAGYGGTVFEPADHFKGDFARAYFYVATRYKTVLSGWSGDSFSGDDLSEWTKNMLLEWHHNDPVSDKEIARNNAVYAIQKNRNPYIDHPEWADCVWASCNALQFTSSPVTQARENESYSYDITYAVDIDSETLTCTSKPSWLTFTPNAAGNSGVLSGTPSAGDVGTSSVELTLVENDITVKQNFSITVVSASAPVMIFDKDFEDVSMTSGGWTTQSVAGNDQAWIVSTYNGSSYAKMSGYTSAKGANANEDWMISPSVNMNDYESEVFSFSSALNFATSIYPTVKYSTNYSGTGSPSSATWTDISVTLPVGNDWVFVSSGDIDVSSISGTNVYFAFVYKSTTSEAATWEVDDIKMSGARVAGVEGLATRSIKLYPNPANNILNIQTEEIGDISIYNIQGVAVYRSSLKKQIDISSFSNGIYFVQIANRKGQVFSSRFVKQ